MEVDFEKFMFSISEFTNEKIDDMNTFRFFILVEYLKEKHSKNGRPNN